MRTPRAELMNGDPGGSRWRRTTGDPRTGGPDPLAFDLNDVSLEPSDEQLAALMDAVGAEARRKATEAREGYARKLHDAMAEARRSGVAG